MRHSAYTLAPEMEVQETEFLIKLVTNERLPGPHLEIGTGAGGTLCLMMTAFLDEERPQFVVVDPMRYFPGQFETVQLNLETYGFTLSNTDIRVTTSEAAFHSAERLGERFGFILIDGKHSLLNVMLDLRWTRLLDCGGIVCLHDYSKRFPGVQIAVNLFLSRNSNCYRVLEVSGSLIAIRKIELCQSREFFLWDWLHAWSQSAYVKAAAHIRRFARSFRLQCLWFTDHLKKKTPEELHTESELRHLAEGREHRTLGPKPEDDGLEDFNALISIGLKRFHRVVDFGCGNLRLGRHLISFLDQGYYWGLDVTDKSSTIGLDHWYPDRTGLPSHARFNVLSPSAIATAAEIAPDIVIVAGVLQCVHPRRLDIVMTQLRALCANHTQVLVILLEADQLMQFGRFSFRHTSEAITRAAASVGLQIRKLQQGLEPKFLLQQQGNAASRGRERETLLLLTTTTEAVTLGALCFKSFGGAR